VIELISPDAQSYLAAMLLQGRIHTRLGQYEQAIVLFDTLLAHDLAVEMRIETLKERAHICDRMGNYEAGAAFNHQALDIMEDGDTSEVHARILNHTSVMALRQGDSEEARRLIERAKDITTKLDNQGLMADILMGQGRVSYLEGDYEQAEIHSLKAISILHQVRDRETEAKAVSNLGVIMWAAGSYIKAREYTEQALELSREIHDQYVLASNQNTLAYILMEMGEQQTAVVAFREAISELKTHDNFTLLMDALIGLATLCSKQGQTTWAAEVLAMVQANPAMSWGVQQSIDPLLKDLQGKMSEVDFERAMARGKVLDLDTVVGDILAASDGEESSLPNFNNN
jgi:tetratricopeptide (TPR) repeat protein